MHHHRGKAVWTCPVCGGQVSARGFDALPAEVSASTFVPSSNRFGEVSGDVVRCASCGHGSLRQLPSVDAVDAAHHVAEDPVSLEEEDGQVATAARDLVAIERHVRPGRLLDVGCWTGSFLVAAERRGWMAEGVEPSRWAVDRATERGVSVQQGSVADIVVAPGAYRAVVTCDVLEHLFDPGEALDRIRGALEPDGILFLTVPDAGSAVARTMGRRWWAVLPMHVQYFTRRSMRLLLERHGFTVCEIRTHPKVFTTGYYTDRLANLSPSSGRFARGVVDRLGSAARPVAPDLRDRMAVVARRVEHAP